MTGTPMIKKTGRERITAGMLFQRSAAAVGDKPALVYRDPGRVMTYKELDAASDAVAKSLIASGLARGAHAAVWAPNIPEWPIIFLGCAKAGVALLGINTLFKAYDLEYTLKQADVEIIFLVSGFLQPGDYSESLHEVCPELKNARPGHLVSPRLPHLKTVVFLGPDKHPGMYTRQEFLSLGAGVDKRQLQERELAVQPDDRCIFFLTSGTTGRPKCALWTHERIIGTVSNISEIFGFLPEDISCITPPFFHLFGFAHLLSALFSRCAVAPIERFAAQELLSTIEALHVTHVVGTPTMFVALLNESGCNYYNTTSLRGGMIAGSVAPPALVMAVIEKMGAGGFGNGYGLSEILVTLTHPTDSLKSRAGSVGRPMPGSEIKIIHPGSSTEVRDGETGELLVKSPFMMTEYYRMPEATAAAIDAEGFLHTGDLGFVDTDGFYHITGRSKDLIIRGGENIAPAEIEEFLLTHPAVLDAQVVGIASTYFGEEPVGFIRLKTGMTITALELKQFCRKHIDIQKVPVMFFFVEQYPLTASGKVQKFRLREMAAEMLAGKKR